MVNRNYSGNIELDNIVILTRKGMIRAIADPRNVIDTVPEYIDDLPVDIHAAVVAIQAYFGNKMGFGEVTALTDELVILASDLKPVPQKEIVNE